MSISFKNDLAKAKIRWSRLSGGQKRFLVLLWFLATAVVIGLLFLASFLMPGGKVDTPFPYWYILIVDVIVMIAGVAYLEVSTRKSRQSK